MTDLLQHVEDTIDEHADSYLALLAALVAVPSPTGEGTAVNRALTVLLEDLGYAVTPIDGDPATVRDDPQFSPPDVAGVGSGFVATRPGPRGMLLYAHTDTHDPHVVPGRWTADPYTLTVAGTTATGVGTADCKGGVAAIIAALRAIRTAGIELMRPPAIALAEAKGGGFVGMYQSVVAAGPSEGALYCHPAEAGDGMNRIKVGSRGTLTFRVTVPGLTPAPIEPNAPISADPRTGENALSHAARIIVALDAWATAQPGLLLSIGRIEAGSDPVAIPDACVFEGVCWFTEGTVASWTEALAAVLAELAAASSWLSATAPALEIVGLRANPASSADSDFAAAVSDIVAAVTGERPEPYGWHTSSDIRFPMLAHGTPTVGIGSIAGNFNIADEWIDTEDFLRMVKVIAGVIVRWDEIRPASAA